MQRALAALVMAVSIASSWCLLGACSGSQVEQGVADAAEVVDGGAGLESSSSASDVSNARDVADASETMDASDALDALDASDVLDGALRWDAAEVPWNHRATATACPSRPPGVVTVECIDDGRNDPGACISDSDCDGGLRGRCDCVRTTDGGALYNRCTYDQCGSDSDCDGGSCACSPTGNVCSPPGDAATEGSCPARPLGTATLSCWQPRSPWSAAFFRQCARDSDCTGALNGRCDCHPIAADGGGRPLTTCSYDQCVSDDDCPMGLCSCAASGNVCISALCRTDADCGDAGYCSPTNTGMGFLYACHTASDECRNDGDCPVLHDPYGGLFVCEYQRASARWVCAAPPPPSADAGSR
jgi:hypothetical protein